MGIMTDNKEGRFSTVKKLLYKLCTALMGVLLCAPVFALGPPGPAHNGGTGYGIDNFYDQIPDKSVQAQIKSSMQPSIQTVTQSQTSEKDDYPRYVNVNKVSNRFIATKP